MERVPTPAATLDALIVGAGPAGVGTAIALSAIESLTLGLVERGEIGQTFRDWPARQRFLTPSFTGNGFGATDLNAVHFATSPAFTLGVDYPTGPQYAQYLSAVSQHFRLPIMSHTEVTRVSRDGDAYVALTNRGPVRTRHIVWAGGEFGEPRLPKVVGNGFLDHASTPAAWAKRGENVLVIGGNESGIELACHHVEHGASVLVVDPEAPWAARRSSDPSTRLAPRSQMRLRDVQATGRLTLSDRAVRRVRHDEEGAYRVTFTDGSSTLVESRPIAATGYTPAVGPIAELLERRPDGLPRLTEDDESTISPGLFVAGPALRHGTQIFCFIYKFRQRFAHVAGVIAERSGYDRSPLEEWRDNGMLTDDLSCCGLECAC
ncbi:NAD(P)/FAD-dependent oxidoreductase [Microcella sp.]|uniref:NAD(P)/FAD-dependent oxidoreductase n=1 Tax=Microcella sp. TaxID=1913979 RepID=UPI00391C9F61